MATMPDSFFSWVVFLLNEYGATLLQGAGVTLLLALVGTFIGCVIGLAVGICQTIPEDPNGSSFKQALVKGLKAVLSSYVEIFRGTPMIVQAMVVYYGAMSLFDIDMSAMFAGFLVVSINTGAYMAETVRGGIESIDEGQREAAVAIGMDHFQTMRYVVLPQALRNIMPQIGNNLMTFTASRILRWLESKMDGPKDYQLVEYDPMADPCGHFQVTNKKGR